MNLGRALAYLLFTAAFPVEAQPILTLTAVGQAGTVRIDVLRWSTDAERDEFVQAWTQPGAARGGRGRGARPAVEEDPFAAGNDPTPGGRGGRGGRGARGGAAESSPPTPEASLMAALGSVPIIGHLWSSEEVAGYSLRYAAKIASPDASTRIILIADRRLGAWNDSWKLAGSPTNYEFSLIELRLNAKSEGEGKASLTSKVAADPSAKTLVLENYDASPVLLKSVKPRS